MVKCLAHGRKHRGSGRGSNPHSDDSAIRTQIQCTKPLGHGTPQYQTSLQIACTSRIDTHTLYVQYVFL